MARKRQQGFTLVELIAVMVVLSICATIGAGFVVDVIDQYQKASLRSAIVMRGSVAMEQMTRKIRLAVPNSIRVSASGQCVEFLPMVAASVYTEVLPDAENGRAATSSIATVGFEVVGASAAFALVAPMASSEIYSIAAPSARATISSLVGTPVNQINLDAPHQFIRNSISSRVLIGANPQRFCVTSGQLINYRDYVFSAGPLDDSSPGGSDVIMADGITASTAFTLTAGSENRNAALDLAIAVTGGSETVQLNNRVLIRNVP